MIKKLLEKLKDEKSNKVFSNFIAMSLVQGVNLILPLLTFPYLVRVLGVEKFGLVMFAQAFMVYFSMTVDYGFNLSGIREISKYRFKPKRIESVFNSIMTAKIFLIIISFIVMNLVVFSFAKFRSDWLLYNLSFGMVLGSTLFPTWFFQGLEKMKYVTILNIVAKSIFTIFIFIFVKTKDDLLFVPLFNALGYIVVGIISLYIIKSSNGINFKIQPIKLVWIQLYRGWHIFLSKISTNLYTATNTFILGIFTNVAIVGYFVIAEKVIRIITTLFVPFYQAIFPYFVQLTIKSKNKTFCFAIKSIKLLGVISISFFTLFHFFKAELFRIVFGEEGVNSIYLAVILSPLIIVNPLSSMIYNVLIVSFKWDSFLAKSTILGAFINLGLILILFNLYDPSPLIIAYSILVTEFFLLGYGVFFIYKKYKLFQ